MAQDPRFPDKSHFEATMVIFPLTPREKRVKRCQAWRKSRVGQCGRQATPGFEVCSQCGSSAVKARNLIGNRAEFQKILGGDNSEHVHDLIDRLHRIAKAGNLDAIKYILDQIYGTAKATVVNEIGNRDLLAAMIRITAQFIKGEEFQEWLKQAQQALADSDSMSSTNSP